MNRSMRLLFLSTTLLSLSLFAPSPLVDLARADQDTSLQRGESLGHKFKIEEILSNRGVIWAMEFISQDQIIFTEREGKLSLFNLTTKKLTSVKNLNLAVVVRGQGGLLDIKPHPQFKNNGLIFLTYSKKGKGGTATTALLRGKLQQGNKWTESKELFQAMPYTSHHLHFGSRIAIRGDDLFFSVGDRGESKKAQDLTNDLGKIHRLKLDGTIPKDNPFINTAKAKKTIYSYGHRNPQGLAFHPKTKQLWEHEHGPRGGDEINIITKGANYGWPVVGYGKHYWKPFYVGEAKERPDIKSPLKQYTPSTAPSGLAFSIGSLFTQWQNTFFVGSLGFGHLHHLVAPEKNDILKENLLLESTNLRIRELLVSQSGHLYFSTDEGSIFKISPL